MKNLKKKRKFLLRISQNSDYLKSACKTQKKKKQQQKQRVQRDSSMKLNWTTNLESLK